jgi:hypothetical protein
VTVTTPGGTSSSSSSDHFTYDATPSVTAISPVAGSLASGTVVTITGTGFMDSIATTGVEFAGTNAASYLINSDTQITATSPGGSPGVADITVTNETGTSATVAADQFTYEATPTVSGISPAAGGTAGTDVVTISGTGFVLGSTTVAFGSSAGTSVSCSSSTSCTATSPGESAGVVDVTVTTPGGTSSSSSSDHFTYDATPSVTAISTAAVPNAPTNVTATAADASATITWTVPAANGRTISSYSVSAADSTTTANGAQSCTADGESAASCTVSGLTNGDSYTFTVTATNSIGTGPASSASNDVMPMAVPGAPTKIRATMSKGASSATVSWTAPSSTGGSPITGYLAKASGSGGQACTTQGATSCTVTRLASGASYTFTVVATNSIGTSPVSTASNPVSARTLSAVSFSLSAKKVTNRREQTERLSVSVSAFAAKNLATPMGTVTVSEPTSKLCVITLSSGRGSCQLTADELGVGTYRLVATYSGSKLYAASRKVQELMVSAAPVTTTLLELSHSSVRYGHEQIENLTAITTTVRAGSPTGNVVLKVGSRVLCVITLKDDIGSCRLSPRQLGVGTYQITADYLGNMVFPPSLTTTKLAVLR